MRLCTNTFTARYASTIGEWAGQLYPVLLYMYMFDCLFIIFPNILVPKCRLPPIILECLRNVLTCSHVQYWGASSVEYDAMIPD